MKKMQLDTPCLVIDKKLLLENLVKMQEEVRACNKQLRPHIKTHKCSTLAKLQIKHGAIGVSAAKVSEALVLAQQGVRQILITSPVVTTTKINQLVECLQQEPSLLLVCDSVNNAQQLNQAMQEKNLHLNVLVDIDPGVARTGVSYEDAISLAQFIHQDCDHLNFRGLQCYAGNLQHVKNYQERADASSSAIQQAAKVKQTLLQQGLPCDILSGSGTGTYDIDMQVPEHTEVQPGSYTVMDREYAEIGSKENPKDFQRFKPAMTMLVTVISANHHTHVTVDAGTKSLYFDPHTKPLIISHPGLHYDWGGFGDEHGKVTADERVSLPPVGEVLEIVVPHCDPTINLHSRFYITDQQDVIDSWDIDMRGCVQ